MKQARPIPHLHELPIERLRPLRKPAPGGTIKAFAILCTNEEFHWVSEALAKRRIKHLRSRHPARSVSRNKTKQD